MVEVGALWRLHRDIKAVDPICPCFDVALSGKCSLKGTCLLRLHHDQGLGAVHKGKSDESDRLTGG